MIQSPSIERSSLRRNRDFSRKVLQPPVTLLAITIAFVLLYLINSFYFYLGGLPQCMPGLTEPEIRGKLYFSNFRDAIIFVGDSRVGWGIAENVATKILLQQKPALHAINAGLPATNIASSINHLFSYKHKQPGVLAINYSPASFYTFESPIIEEKSKANFGQLFEKEVRYLIQERICFFLNGKTFLKLIQSPNNKLNNKEPDVGWTDRNIYPEGFVQARLVGPGNKPIDSSAFQLHFYDGIIKQIIQNQPAAIKKREAMINTLQEAKSKGWNIILIRLPVGPNMRQLENKLPQTFQPEVLAQQLDIPYIDFQNFFQENTTVDQSHIKSNLVPQITETVIQKILSDFICRSYK